MPLVTRPIGEAVDWRPAPVRNHMPEAMGVAMSDEAVHTRRWLINASGAAVLSNAIPVAPAAAQTAAAAAPRPSADGAEDSAPISAAATTLADYVAKTLDRELPAEVVARTKL